ncbi:sensor histidine kinase [Streptomyces sp. NPDC058295]|uniref:sensor histidine kinase n=1 Tax=Streptomyces sp. NPDC058295 TaxID=3346431 RepID=UPI0036E3408E
MITALRRFAAAYPRTTDAVVALVLFVLATTGTAFSGVTGGKLWSGVLLAAVGAAATLWHRTRPWVVAVVATLCAILGNALGHLVTPLLLAPSLTALYWLALKFPRRTVYPFTIVVAVVQTVLAVANNSGEFPFYFDVLNTAPWIPLATETGLAVALRRAYLDSIHARAEHAERTREQEARQRVAEERVRIARDLHDVVAHHLAVANAQAGTAAHLVRKDPEQAQRLLDDLAGTTASALRELKATVGLLRQADDPDGPLEPAPGLDQLPELFATVEAAGLRVTVLTDGEPSPLSPGVDLTAYRIVQEALTNITKHAPAARATVRLGYFPDHLAITVTDDGEGGPAPTPPGFGLIGMRERARSVGGSLRTGPRPEGGFEVSTSLPLHPRTAPTEESPAP